MVPDADRRFKHKMVGGEWTRTTGLFVLMFI